MRTESRGARGGAPALLASALLVGCGGSGGGGGNGGALPGLTQEAYVKASNADPFDYFGAPLAISGDTLVVGAPTENGGAAGVDGDESDDSVPDAGAVYVFVRSGTTWTQQAYLKASNPEANDGFGRSVAIDGDTVVVGAPFEDGGSTGVGGDEASNAASAAGAAYVFVRSGTTWTQQAYLKASNTETEDFFGGNVAVSGATVVVGAGWEDGGSTGVDGDQASNAASASGAVYVFVRSGTTWTQQAYLKASNTGADDGFGTALAVSGDRIVVGAPGEDSASVGVDGDQADDGASAGGAAYVFVRSGAAWAQEAYLKASNTDADDFFGWSVAIDGDVVVVGAPNEASAATGVDGDPADDSLPLSGAAYVFVRSGVSWTQEAYLKAARTDLEDSFGLAVGVSGDSIVVGAPYEDGAAAGVNGDPADDSASDSGAAYVFVRAGSAWAQEAYVKASNPGTDDLFGYFVGISGSTVVAAATSEDSDATGIDGDESNDGAFDSGAVYVFR